MGTQLNENGYLKLITEDIEAMNKHMPVHSLEKKHIIEVLFWSKDMIYHKMCAPKILCSAVWYKDGKKYNHMPRNVDSGLVVYGYGHGNCMATLKQIFPERDYVINNKDGNTTIQGFLTSNNRFVDRKEGSAIAFKAGQIKEDKGYLYTEDLLIY